MLHTIDSLLNRFTMYRVVLYGLGTLLLAAEALALTGAIGISASGLAVSIVMLIIGCYLSNRLFAWWFHAAANTESWLITALILACILPPVNSISRAVLMLAAGLIAMASKYLLVRRGIHALNPAAVAAFVTSITGVLPATWWIATPWLTPFTAILALAVLRKQRKFSLFFSFAAAALLMLLYVSSVLHGTAVEDTLRNAALSWPIIFMGSIMLTEPTTLPPTKYYQIWLGVLIGVIFSSQLHYGRLAATPELALLLGNIFTTVFTPSFGRMLKLKELRALTADIYEAVFERPQGAFAFAPGQYLEWTLPHARADARGNRRMFSIASAPSEPDLRIGFRHYERSSSFKTALIALEPGKYIRAAHVAGNFTLPQDTTQPLLFIAGGIGITPFRSMAKQLVATQAQCDIVLLYFAAKQEDFVFQDVFQEAAAFGLRVQYVVGRPDAAALQNAVAGLAARTVYLSGPDALVSGCKATLLGLGIQRQRIHTDHFTGY
jgi:ferredoxin-NADP reductase